MPKFRGPHDETIEQLATLLIARRGRSRMSLNKEEKRQFDEAMRTLLGFTRNVGLFGTDNLELIDAVFLDILDAFRGHIGKMGWIRSAKWLLPFIGCGLTYSGRMYVEIRERIHTLSTRARLDFSTNVPRSPAIMNPKLNGLLFQDGFRSDACTLNRHRHKKSVKMKLLGICPRGCDVLLLERLGFHEVIIGRILGLKRGTTVNRILACKNNALLKPRVPTHA